jgi:hypothetical protein
MRLKKLIHLGLVALAALPVCAADLPDFFRVRTATDVQGKPHSLGAAAGTKAVVLVFLGPECPVSQRYVPELNRIAAGQGTNDVEFCGIISGKSITRSNAAFFVKEYAIQYPVLFDDAGLFARWLRPTHVPEAFVLKPDGDVAYRGRINDWYQSPGKPRAVIQHHELRDAIAAVRVGKTPPRLFAQPVGCYFEDWPSR